MITDFVKHLQDLERRILNLEFPKIPHLDDYATGGVAVKTGGTGVPDFAVFQNGLYLYTFSDQAVAGNEKQIFFTVQLPHSWKEGSTIEPHCHIAPEDNAGGVVRMGLEYSWQNIDGTFGASTTTYVDKNIGTTAKAHKLASFGNVDGTGMTASSILVCRLFRNSSNANDTYTGKSVFLLSVDVHIKKDKLGEITSP